MSTIIVIMQFFYLKSPKKLFKDYNNTKEYKIYYFTNPIGFDGVPLLLNPTNSNAAVTAEDIIAYGKPIFNEFLTNIQKMTGTAIENDYFFLVRFVANKGSAGDELQAEGWHHDYMWAPSEFSSIIYTKTDNMRLKAADFCVYGMDRSKQKATDRENPLPNKTFGTDSWGPGIGSFFTRNEIYEQYRVFLNSLKCLNLHNRKNFTKMIDPNYTIGYSICVRITDNEIAFAEILNFYDNKIIIRLIKYGQYPVYFDNSDLIPETDKWWKLENLVKKLNDGINPKIIKVDTDNKVQILDSGGHSVDQYYVNFDDWDISWKLKLSDLNPGNLNYNLFRGKDKFEQELAKKKAHDADTTELKTLIFKNFAMPLYERYKEKNGTESGCTKSRYVDQFKTEEGGVYEVKLNDGILWDNKNTWHRSPFIKPIIDNTKEFERSFINIRIIKVSDDRPTPYKDKNLDFSQFQKKYLKYKSKYLKLQKQLKK